MTIILTYTYLSRAPYCKYKQTRKELNIQLRRVGLVTRVKQCKTNTSNTRKSKPPLPLKSTLLLPPTWYRFGAEKGAGNPEWLEGFRITKGAGIEMIFFLKIKRKSVCSGSKCHSISFRCMCSVLFSSEHLKYLHLVWYHLLTLSQEKEAIKTLTVGTSQLHYCMCVCVGAVVNDSSQSFLRRDDQSGA